MTNPQRDGIDQSGMAIVKRGHRALIAQPDPCKQVKILVSVVRRISYDYDLGLTVFVKCHAILVSAQIGLEVFA